MTNIYIVKAGGGSYDDAWESNLFAVGDAQAAELAVWDLQLRHKFCESIWPQVRDAMEPAFALIRSFKGESFPPEPTVPPKANKEQREALNKARAEWRKQCEPITARNHARLDAIMKEGLEAAKAKAIELGANEDHLKDLGFYSHTGKLQHPNFSSDVHYEWEELELR